MEQHTRSSTRGRTVGLAVLAALVALVAAVSASSAEGTAGTAAPVALTQDGGYLPIQETTPPAESERPNRLCPKDGEGGPDGGEGSGDSSGTTPATPAPAL